MQKLSPLTSLRGHFEALALLQSLAAEVAPIMKKRGWVVREFMEFLPDSPGLLGVNVNRGHEIKIRLRRHASDTDFLVYRDLVGTTLHELVHMEIGPHEAPFYKLLDTLWEEYEDMEDKGTLPTPGGALAGTPAVSGGQRLGGRVAPPGHGRPPVRSLALQAAEKRARLSSLTAGSGSRLGGPASAAATSRPTSREERRALMASAAERRRVDDVACGCTADGFSLAHLDEAVAKSLAAETPSSTLSSTSSASVAASPVVPGPTHWRATDVVVIDDDEEGDNEFAKRSSRTGHIGEDDGGAPATWHCHLCTFINSSLLPVCEMCGGDKG